MPTKQLPDIPDEIWEQIISKISLDRYLSQLSTLSSRFLSLTNQFKRTLFITKPTARFLPRLLRRFPNLKHISFEQFYDDPDEILGEISRFGVKLETLDLSNQVGFPVKWLIGMKGGCLEGIRVLRLKGVGGLGDRGLGLIGKLMPELVELDLSEPRDDYGDAWGDEGKLCEITDDGVAVLAGRLKGLRKIDLSGNCLVSDRSVAVLCEKCMDLEEIVVDKCSFVTKEGISRVLRECVNLKSVRLHGMEVLSPEFSEPLGCARNVNVIHFAYMGVSDGLLLEIIRAKLPLRKFTLFHCQNFTFSGILSLLRVYQGLEYLALEGVYFLSDQCMVDLSKFLRNAVTIKLNFCSKLTDSSFFTLVKNCPLLNSLEMEKTDMGKQEFAVNNVNNVKLRVLSLASNKTLSNECLEQIACTCPKLEVLDVSYCVAISRKGVGDILRNCHELRHLQISGCSLVKNLGVGVDLPKLEVLQASGAGLNDEGLTLIGKRCSGLMYLDVTCCNGITSSGVLDVVGSCTKLKELYMNWCRNVSRDIVLRLVITQKSLRKIVPPHGMVYSVNEKNFFWEHGCYVCER